MSRPRLVAIALLAVLLTPSAAAAGSLAEHEPVPPQAGDRGRYRVVDAIEDGSAAAQPSTRVEVGTPRLADDAYGRDRVVWGFTVQPAATTSLADGSPTTTWLATRGLTPVATDRPAPPSEGFSFRAGGLGDGEAAIPDGDVVRYASTDRPLASAACLVLDAPPSGDAPIHEDGCLASLIDRATAAGLDASVRIDRVDRLDTGDTRATVVLELAAEGLTATVERTYRASIPFPTRVELDAHAGSPLADPDQARWIRDNLVRPLATLAGHAAEEPIRLHGQERTIELELTGYEPGRGPQLTPAPAHPWPTRRGDTELAPLTAWGPADGGESFPFDRAEATRSIENDPSLADFHAWRKAHPDARAILAAYGLEDGGRVEVWSFWFAAPDRTAWGIRSTARADPDAAGVGAVDRSVVTNDAERFDRLPPCPDGCTFSVDPGAQRVPTIRSTLDLWQQQAALDASRSSPTAYAWVFSPWFGETRAAAGWSPAPGEDPLALFGGAPQSEDASAVVVSPRDGALIAEQGVGPGSQAVQPLGPTSDLAPASTAKAPGPGALATGILAGVSVAVVGALAIGRRRA